VRAAETITMSEVEVLICVCLSQKKLALSCVRKTWRQSQTKSDPDSFGFVQPLDKAPNWSETINAWHPIFWLNVFARCVSHLPNCLASAKNSGDTEKICFIRSEREPHLAESKQANPVVTIKKYANRRLYNTATSAYVTLDHLAQMVRDGVDFVVFDAKSGDDITRSILTQIILEAESSGNNLLPVGFLRDIIRSYGDSVQGFLPSYLDLAMKSFTDSREHFSKSLNGGFDLSAPVEFFQQAVRTNMSMMAEAAKAFTGVVAPTALRPTSKSAQKSEASEELVAMRAQMAAMQARLDKLDGTHG
jgi:polyhydroxyalkanoate synthesis repressor PhaR